MGQNFHSVAYSQGVIASGAKQSLPEKEIASSLAAPRNDSIASFVPLCG
jgi:hypothetical protein